MEWQQFVGYLGSFLMFSTFWMKTMIPLRAAGMAANCAMMVYAASMALWPIFVMQAAMFPVNIYRLVQMRALLLRVAQFSAGDFRPDALIPFMTKERFEAGHLLFNAGDESDKLYIIRSGKIRLEELNYELGPGELFGEIGIVSDKNLRTATAVCTEATTLHSISRERVTELFFQNPEFGFYLIRLVTARLLNNRGVATGNAS